MVGQGQPASTTGGRAHEHVLHAALARQVLEGWPDELLVRMVRVVRGALLIDDGAGGDRTWRDAWASMGYVSAIAGKVGCALGRAGQGPWGGQGFIPGVGRACLVGQGSGLGVGRAGALGWAGQGPWGGGGRGFEVGTGQRLWGGQGRGSGVGSG
jgi:hypothetical protein